MSKTYRAGRFDTMVIVHERGERQRQLDPRLDLKRHALGYEWGVFSAPALQLSLALLCDALGDDQRALALYEAYTLDRVSKLSWDAGILLTSDVIRLDCRLMEDRAKREAAE